MAKRKTGQEPADAPPRPIERLTYKQSRFAEEYARHGNGTKAAIDAGYGLDCAAEQAYENLRKPHIAKAIDAARAARAAALNITRDDLLLVLLGMVAWQPGDFDDILDDPGNAEAYTALGYKAHAIKAISKSAKNGNSITFVDKKAAADDLWDKLGFDKDVSKKDRGALLGRLLGIVDGKLGSGSNGSDGAGTQ